MPKKNPEDGRQEPEAVAATAAVAEPVVGKAVSGAAKSVYSVEQLTRQHVVLGATREIVAVALRKGGKAVYTLEEAQKLVEKLKNKEVK